jgi:excinuclease ABC subunit C
MLTRLRQDDGARYFGPFAHSASARHTLTLARRKFNLRGCRGFTPGPEDYKHCLYGHLKYCTAPCIGNISLEDYRRQGGGVRFPGRPDRRNGARTGRADEKGGGGGGF